MQAIPEFYKNQDVFISGGTGFMGRVLIEKLLRSCSGLNKIYVLMRAKRGKSIESRIEELKALPLFDVLKSTNPQVLDKIEGIEGNVVALELGLSDSTRNLLKNVTIIFHLAACVRFDDPLKDAIILNTRATHEMIKFAIELKNIKAFVHVSTTYSNPDHTHIEEKIYPPHGDWRKVIKIAETLDKEDLNSLSYLFTDHMPNTYTYTKGLAEQICNDYKDQLPISIFRPAIVISTEKEPVPGWIDNFNGPIGLTIGGGTGILRTIMGTGDEELNCISVDLAIKGIIVASWISAHRQFFGIQKDNLEIYNSARYTESIRGIIEKGCFVAGDYALTRSLWVPTGVPTTSKIYFNFRLIAFQVLPAMCVDALLRFSGKKPFLLKVQRRAANALTSLQTFIERSWVIETDNFDDINNKILPSDRESFGVDDTFYSTDDIFENALAGGRTYMCGEKAEDLPKARARYRKLKFLDKWVNKVVSYVIFHLSVNYLKTFIHSG